MGLTLTWLSLLILIPLAGLFIKTAELSLAQFVGTVTRKLMTYSLGRGVEYFDQPAVRKIVRDAAANDYKFESLVLGLVAGARGRVNTVYMIAYFTGGSLGSLLATLAWARCTAPKASCTNTSASEASDFANEALLVSSSG